MYNVIISQVSDKDWDLLFIKEDVVIPAQAHEYEMALADLKNYLVSNENKNINYLTHLQDDYHFTYVTSIDDLDKLKDGIHSFLFESPTPNELKLILSNMDETIESSHSYVVKYHPEYSFVPDDDLWLHKAPYRRWNFYYFTPGKEQEVEKLLLAWKNLYAHKNLEYGYRVFSGLLGTETPLIIFTTWASDPRDYQSNLEGNMLLLGEQGAVLWQAILEMVRKVKTVEGWYLPQYSYQPE